MESCRKVHIFCNFLVCLPPEKIECGIGRTNRPRHLQDGCHNPKGD